jgi:hypothetical protein
VPEGAIEVYALWLDEPAEDEDEEQVVGQISFANAARH